MTKRELTGDEARQLIDDILSRTNDPFIMHLNWKRSGEKNKIEQHLSFHGTWNSQEILATGKGRNQQIQNIVMQSIKRG